MFEDISGKQSIQLLTTDLQSIDGRPVFSANGKEVIFMRQPHNGNPGAPAKLYRVKRANDVHLIPTINPTNHQSFNATRPDFSLVRKNFEIAFDAVEHGIWLVDLKTFQVKQILAAVIADQVYTWSYPAWFPNGRCLSVTNYNQYNAPLYHTLVKVNIQTPNQFAPITNNQEVWPGESSVSQCNPHLIAYAGQTTPNPIGECNCPQGCLPDGYAQDCNQIWLQRCSHASPINDGQGRAPWISPNGKWIVFESNRANPDYPNLYRLFLYSIGDKRLRIITPSGINVQHAKWSPDSKRLVFAMQLYEGAWGIATLKLKL